MCRHDRQVVKTESDGCYWMQCADCPARGPKRHSVVLAASEAEKSMRVRG